MQIAYAFIQKQFKIINIKGYEKYQKKLTENWKYEAFLSTDKELQSEITKLILNKNVKTR